jgi:hypothetical protein
VLSASCSAGGLVEVVSVEPVFEGQRGLAEPQQRALEPDTAASARPWRRTRVAAYRQGSAKCSSSTSGPADLHEAGVTTANTATRARLHH